MCLSGNSEGETQKSTSEEWAIKEKAKQNKTFQEGIKRDEKTQKCNSVVVDKKKVD